MTTAGTWYPPSCGTGGFLIELTNPPVTMTNPTEPTTQTPELLLSKPPEVFAESLEVPSYSQRCEIARLAYAAGADAELEAICEWLREKAKYPGLAVRLRAFRRPKPPSLKEQALDDLNSARRLSIPQPDGSCGVGGILLSAAQVANIIRALESLPDPQ
jgi:hypothetical protein